MNTYDVSVMHVPGVSGSMTVRIRAPYTDVAEQMACRQTGGNHARAHQVYERKINTNNNGGGGGFIESIQSILGLGFVGIIILMLL